MTRKTDKLTTVAVKAAQPRETDYKIADGDGLYVLVKSTGSRLWRLKYRHGGRECLLALGAFPEVSLAEARKRRDEARAVLRQGRDPGAIRKAAKEAQRREVAGGFPECAAAWLAFQKPGWEDATYRKAEFVVRVHLTPALKRTNVATLTTVEAVKALVRIAEQAPTLATKARGYLGSIVRYAIRNGLREDGRLLDLRGSIPKYEKGHIPAATTAAEIVPLIRAVDAYESPITRAALQLTMLTALRPGVVAAAPWSEFDLDAGEWHIPAPRMKTRHAHIVSLPVQALASLRELQKLTGEGAYVFPSPARQKTPHLHRDAMSKALRGMGFAGKHAAHGFRAMLRTYGKERLGIDVDVLEAQLAHAKKGDVQKAYDRTQLLEQRREVMQGWADHLDLLRTGGKVVPLAIRRRAV